MTGSESASVAMVVRCLSCRQDDVTYVDKNFSYMNRIGSTMKN